MAKETAEQKLLKLIEQTNAQQTVQATAAAPDSAATASAAPEAQKAFQSVTTVGVSGVALPAALTNGLDFLKNLVLGRGQGFGLREFNRLFIFVLVAFSLFFVIDLMSGMEKSKAAIKKIFKESSATAWGAQGAVWTPVVKPFEDYAKVISQRNIFQPIEEKIAKKPEQVEEGMSGLEKIASQVKDLKLVGISWLDTPESASAMIENTSSGTTYFLSEGDRIQNVMIKKIFADSIVVSDGLEEMELKL